MVVDENGQILPHCLGYCGRYFEANSSDFSCRACPWGFRATSGESSPCEPCQTQLPAYDWMYLLFVALLPLLLHFQFVRHGRRFSRHRYFDIAEYVCVLLENISAALISVLIYPPRFTFLLTSCEKSTMREWYPVLHNPRIGYSKTMKCSSEIVFPLYSLPFAHHLVLISAILIFRSILYCALLYKSSNGKPFYYSLISLPILAGVHSLFAGILFYSFPWILLTSSIMILVYHLAEQGKLAICDLLARLVSSPMHLTILLITTLLLSFSLTAIIIPLNFSYRWFCVGLVPIPLIVYIITLPFTHPAKITKA
ncbi:unnamed protein product [Caenorhabditis angaria]|uniref:JNK1/MAPK8-associated membrane protein n=1 Tax=Caenorhabditis angaria TaxID=860376 RepID=A0A9P1IT85_9PELO|nr:unnamed protein product [Caenorhabditis angaria]